METLLREKDNKFYKVPLNNYSQFMFLKLKISGRKCQLSKLPNFIQCKNIKFLSEIKKIINNPDYKQKKAVVIYFNEFDKNYYYDINCTKKIEGAPDSLGILSIDKQIIVGKTFDFIIKYVYVNLKKIICIYFNEYDKKYYSDINCTNIIEGAPNSLGTLSKEKRIISSQNIDYHIENAFVITNNLNNYQFNEPPIRNKDITFKKLLIIFFNKFDFKYYYDKECHNEIIDAPESLGKLSAEKKTIIGTDVDYSIENVYVKKFEKPLKNIYYNEFTLKYYYDKECTNEIIGAPNSLGTLSSDKKTIKGYDIIYIINNVYMIRPFYQHIMDKMELADYLYDKEKKVFYISNYVLSEYNLIGNYEYISYNLNGKSNIGFYTRVCLSDINNENTIQELLRKSKKVSTSVFGKSGIHKIVLLVDQNGDKYFSLDDNNLKNIQFIKTENVLIKNTETNMYYLTSLLRYSPTVRCKLEDLLNEELVFEQQSIITKNYSDEMNSQDFGVNYGSSTSLDEEEEETLMML